MKTIKFLFLFVAFIYSTNNFAQVGIGTTTPQAALDITSTTSGLLVPRMLSTERIAITTPANGLQVFDTDTKSIWYYDTTILPAPGAWVEMSSKGNEAWAYNGTDAIEAKRALDGGNSVGITNTGRAYSILDGYNWETQTENAGGTINIFTTNPAKAYPNVQLGTFNASSNITSAFNSPFGIFPANLKSYEVTQAHVAAVSNADKFYMLNNDEITFKGVTSAGSSLYGNSLGVATDFATSGTVSNLYGQSFSVQHFGTGTVNNMRLIDGGANVHGTGNVPTLRGINFQVNVLPTATGTIGNISGINASVHHEGSGTVGSTNLVGAAMSVRSGGAAPIPNQTTGISLTTRNISSSTSTGSQRISGIQNTVSNTGVAAFNRLEGYANTMSTATGAGVSTNIYGYVADIRNQATATTAMTNMHGINELFRHSGGSQIASLMGQTRTMQITGAGTGTLAYGIDQLITSSSTGTGTTNALRALNLVTNHTSATSNITALTAINNQFTNSGKVSAATGLNTTMSNNSATTNTISLWRGGNIASEFGAVSNDNVTTMNGLEVRNANFSTGTLGTLQGLTVNNLSNSNTAGTVVTQRGMFLYNEVNGVRSVTNNSALWIRNDILGGAKTITDNYGIRIVNAFAGNSPALITNNYDLFVGGPSGASTETNIANNFSIYSDGGKSYFKGNVGLGTTTPSVKLDVNGAIKIGSETIATPTAGMIRFNSATSKFEGYDGTNWVVFH